jgi:predicted RNase H-like HicB family nuclease
MTRVNYENFEKGLTKNPKIFEKNLKIILVEDVLDGGYTSSLENITSGGKTKEQAVINILETYNMILETGKIKLNPKQIKNG